eukprot:TRINITY_DN487_c0_g3_i1.p1 TRINITY_DN487_c0_g3~~TRINITY_DN487_c0_g3_i1.p1  ORF type:complete len:180 (-),score=24.10 TRINITY_DN487_c0_g3_i1:203-742(-)
MNFNHTVDIQAKPFYYRSDGSGRDTYIHHFNGGLYTQDLLHKLQVKQIAKENNMKFSAKNDNFRTTQQTLLPRISHYQSDGSGRDLYIKVNEGGLIFNGGAPQSHVDLQFSSSLRQYQRIPSKTQKIDFFQTTQTWRPQKIREQDFQLKLNQSQLIKRLSQPKQMSITLCSRYKTPVKL